MSRAEFICTIVYEKLGRQAFEKLTPCQQELLDAFILGGCCGHKDLNAFKYGATAMEHGWDSRVCSTNPPVLLANKVNATTIQAAESEGAIDSVAMRKAIEASTRGGVKLV